MKLATLRVGWRRGDPSDALLSREWLVTNGLGGYASGTAGGVATRRFHAPLVAALPAPAGRIVALARLDDAIAVDAGPTTALGSAAAPSTAPAGEALRELALEDGLPVWRYAARDVDIEKRLLLLNLRNTVHVGYRVLRSRAAVTLVLRPWFNFRHHEAPTTTLHGVPSSGRPAGFPYDCLQYPHGIEVTGALGTPSVRIAIVGPRPVRLLEDPETVDLEYAIERSRGYDHRGPVASPGRWDILLEAGEEVTVVASTDQWADALALRPEQAREAEAARRRMLMERAPGTLAAGPAAELVWAADQFIVTPHARADDEYRLRAAGHDARAIIAGYPWFTDWGRDTMIALEGLTLLTGDTRDAADILRTMAAHVRDGIVPNYFPEGAAEPLYHTADASLWFVHAINRYGAVAGDASLRRELLRVVHDIVEHHLHGTRFGIGMDPRDGLLRQGAPGYQLTWMDAKVGDWVVTPRRGKAVEINALWYNALRLCAQWTRDAGDDAGAELLEARAAQVYASFNQRFWNAEARHCHDVVDVEGRDGEVDSSLRPNQLLAISLTYPVLHPERWADVMTICRDRLLTPVGVRTLAPGHPGYQSRYDGDVRARDAAYHQGSVWPWLLGPMVDAWIRTYGAESGQLDWLHEGLALHLGGACLGQISEIMDADAPFTPRGCVAQAWSVAEMIRALIAARAATARPGLPDSARDAAPPGVPPPSG